MGDGEPSNPNRSKTILLTSEPDNRRNASLSKTLIFNLCFSLFIQQRARGQRNDNPSVSQFLEIAQALMIHWSLAMGCSISIRKQKETPDLSPLCQPLPKHACTRSIKET